MSASAPLPVVSPPPRLPRDATVGGLAFHRLVFARRRSGWWTPLVTGLLAGAFYLAMLVVGFVVVAVTMLVDPTLSERILRTADVAFDLSDPLMLAGLLLTIVLMLPAYYFASWIVNGRRVGLISSAAGRLRWRWMLVCGVAAVVVAVVLSGASMLLPTDAPIDAGEVLAPADNPNLWATLLVVLLVVPLQAAAEEYAFRGYLMQAVGRWLRHPAFAILLPVPLFVLGHVYDPLGQASVAVFAIAAGWMTWRTGGLEAAIALHVVNNLTAFGLALAGLSDINASAPGVASFVFSTVLVGGYTALVEVMFRRSGMGRTLTLLPEPVPVSVPVAQA